MHCIWQYMVLYGEISPVSDLSFLMLMEMMPNLAITNKFFSFQNFSRRQTNPVANWIPNLAITSYSSTRVTTFSQDTLWAAYSKLFFFYKMQLKIVLLLVIFHMFKWFPRIIWTFTEMMKVSSIIGNCKIKRMRIITETKGSFLFKLVNQLKCLKCSFSLKKIDFNAKTRGSNPWFWL